MIRFNQDYRGKLTAEVFFTAGAEENFGPETEKALVDRAVASFVVKKSAGAKNKATKPTKTK